MIFLSWGSSPSLYIVSHSLAFVDSLISSVFSPGCHADRLNSKTVLLTSVLLNMLLALCRAAARVVDEIARMSSAVVSINYTAA